MYTLLPFLLLCLYVFLLRRRHNRGNVLEIAAAEEQQQHDMQEGSTDSRSSSETAVPSQEEEEQSDTHTSSSSSTVSEGSEEGAAMLLEDQQLCEEYQRGGSSEASEERCHTQSSAEASAEEHCHTQSSSEKASALEEQSQVQNNSEAAPLEEVQSSSEGAAEEQQCDALITSSSREREAPPQTEEQQGSHAGASASELVAVNPRHLRRSVRTSASHRRTTPPTLTPLPVQIPLAFALQGCVIENPLFDASLSSDSNDGSTFDSRESATIQSPTQRGRRRVDQFRQTWDSGDADTGEFHDASAPLLTQCGDGQCSDELGGQPCLRLEQLGSGCADLDGHMLCNGKQRQQQHTDQDLLQIQPQHRQSSLSESLSTDLCHSNTH